MEKRYNFRIYPTVAQEMQIRKNLGCVRFIYNHYLVKRREVYEREKRILSYKEMCRDMTLLKKEEGYEWLQEADHNSLQRAIRQLDLAYQKFFRNIKTKGAAPGYPGFLSKRETRQSYTSPASQPRIYVSKKTGEVYRPESSVALYENRIKLPKLGLVKCRVSKKVEGRILSASVIRCASGKYYVSVVFTECQTEPLERTYREAGMQLGLRQLITTSDGIEIENPRFFKKSERKIARLQRELSRKTRGSRSYERTRIQLTRAYEHIRNQKKDTLHKITTQLVQRYDLICVRHEPLMKMLQDRRYARQLGDAGWGELIRLMAYKCEWYDKQFVRISPNHPTTRRCSRCGHEYGLVSEQKALYEWDCPVCSSHHRRGVNAAINILLEGKHTLIEDISAVV